MYQVENIQQELRAYCNLLYRCSVKFRLTQYATLQELLEDVLSSMEFREHWLNTPTFNCVLMQKSDWKYPASVIIIKWEVVSDVISETEIIITKNNKPLPLGEVNNFTNICSFD